MGYQIYSDDTETSANQTKGYNTFWGVSHDMTKADITATAMALALHLEHENWMYAQVMALPEEAQEKYMDKHGHGKKEHDDEMMEFVQTHTRYFTI